MTENESRRQLVELLLVAGIASVKHQERIERSGKHQDRSVTELDQLRAARKLADYVDAVVQSIQPDVQDGQLHGLNWPTAAEASSWVLKVLSWIAKGDIAVDRIDTVGLNLEAIAWRRFNIREVASAFPDE